MPEKPQDILPIKPKGIKSLSTSFDNDKFLQIKNQEILNYNIVAKREISVLRDEIRIDNIYSKYEIELKDIKDTLSLDTVKKFEKFEKLIKKRGIKFEDFLQNWNLFKSINIYAKEMFSDDRSDSGKEQMLGYFYNDINKIIKSGKLAVDLMATFLNSLENKIINSRNIYTLGLFDFSNILKHDGFYNILNFLKTGINIKLGGKYTNSKAAGVNFIKLIQDFGDREGITDYGYNSIIGLIDKISLFIDRKLGTYYDEIYLYTAYDQSDPSKNIVLGTDIALFDLIKKNEKGAVKTYYKNESFAFIKDVNKLKNSNKKILIYVGQHGIEPGSFENINEINTSLDNLSLINDNIDFHYEQCFANTSGTINNHINYGSMNYILSGYSSKFFLQSYQNSNSEIYNYDNSNSHNYWESIVSRLIYDNTSISQIGIGSTIKPLVK